MIFAVPLFLVLVSHVHVNILQLNLINLQFLVCLIRVCVGGYIHDCGYETAPENGVVWLLAFYERII